VQLEKFFKKKNLKKVGLRKKKIKNSILLKKNKELKLLINLVEKTDLDES
jgi:hypothetical protein